jgi:hypothetical protein
MMHGQCRFEFVDTQTVRLRPFNGCGVMVGDNQCTLPPNGITADQAGLDPNTTYFAYLRAGRQNLALEFSKTPHLTDAPSGVEVKADDFSRTLVGMVRTSASGLFQPGLLTLSWFNRQRKTANAHFTDARMTDFAHDYNVYVELHQEIRVPFLTWGEAVRFDVNGCVGNDTRGHTTRTAVGLNGTTPLPDARSAVALPNITGAGGQFAPLSLGFTPLVNPQEGYHFATLLGNVSTGEDINVPGEHNTGIWSGRYPNGVYCSLHVEVMG